MFAQKPRKETMIRFMLVMALLFNTFTSVSVLAQEPEPTASVTPEITESPAATTTIEQIITTTVTSTPELATATAIPALTTSPVDLATPSPETATITPSITLSSAPDFITPGGKLMLTWEVTGISLSTQTYILNLTLSEGISPVEKKDIVFDETSRVVTILVEDMKGKIHLQVENPPDDLLIEASLLENGEVIATTALFLSAKEQFLLDEKGGSIEAQGGRIKIQFPKDTLPEKTIIHVGKPSSDAVPKYSLLGKPFEIKARKEKTDEELRQFTELLSITVSYADLGISEQLEGDLALYWYDTEMEEWVALLTSVDREAKTITALTDHFTVFDIGINNWQSSRLPTVDSFQVSEFTGAGTYSYPIEVPPGPGGFKPNIALTYNSQIVDQSTLNTQASWVGMGWSLETGSIMIDERRKPNVGWEADTHLLSVGGISTRIVKDPSGIYHAADENFWKITFNGSTWTVWDKQGNSYYFEKIASYPYQEGDCKTSNAEIKTKIYGWFLTRIVNIHGKTINYEYQEQTKNTIWLQQYYSRTGKCTTFTDKVGVTATYPKTIRYADNKYQVRFVLASTGRLDYRSSWDTDPFFHFYAKQRLGNIYVEQDIDGNGIYETILRRYEFAYKADNAIDIIFPGYTWSAGGKTTTLASVSEYGVGGSSALPSVTFAYGDNLHLTRATNGYGGIVEFDYDDDPTKTLHQPWYYTADARDSYTLEVSFGRDFGPCYWNDPFPWYARPGGTVHCGDGDRDPLYFRGAVTANGIVNQATSIYGENQLMDMIRPGGMYKLTTDISLPPGVSGQVGLFSGYADVLQSISSGGGTNYVMLPVNASTIRPVFTAIGGTEYASSRYFKFQLLPSVYRVKTKRISDDNGQTYKYMYSYSYLNDSGVDSAGVNDSILSPNGTCNREDTTCNEYFERFSEFRGHSQVTVTGPDGVRTITKFYQDDIYKGKPITTVAKIGSQKLTETLYGYRNQQLPIAVYSPCGPCLPYRGLGRYWVYTEWAKNVVYAIDGSPQGETRTFYVHDSTYGNILTETEQYLNGTEWAKYRVKEYTYYPNDSSTRYLVSLPARIRNLDVNDNVLSSTVFLYDNNTGGWPVPPVNGVLTAVRTRISTDGNQWSQVSYGYDAWGNRTSETTYSGYGTYSSNPATGARTTTTVYDPVFHVYPISQTTPPTQNVPGGLTTTWVYDYNNDGLNDYILGVPTKETGPNGNVTKAAYDPFGRIVSLTRPDDTNPTLSMSYTNSYPFTTTITLNPMNYIVTRQYDGMGREIFINSGGVKVSTLYDSATVTRQSVPYEGASTADFTTTTVTPLTRTTTVKAPDGTQTSTQVDGLSTKYTDARGNYTITKNDVWGRIVSVDAPDGPDVAYTYDELNRLKKATRGDVTITLNYDHGGRKTSMSDPDMGNWSYTYDALGNLTRQTDARGQRICLYYDSLNRLIGKHYRTDDSCPANPTFDVAYSYDQGTYGKGLRTSMTSLSNGQTVTSSWTYDARGRLKTETVMGYTTEWGYNAADMPIWMKYPDNETVNYTYNSRMLLNSVIGSSTYVASTAYDSAGRIDLRTLGNSTQTDYVYYPWTAEGGRLQYLKSGTAGNPVSLQNLSYAYDDVGNIENITNTLASETNTYTYDTLNRLTSWTLNGGTPETYSYDASGNLDVKASVDLNYNDAAHVHAVTHIGSTQKYWYDANGSQTTRIIGADTYNLLYDAESRLVEVKKNSMTMATFVYDGDGRRVKSTVNGTTTVFVGGHYELTGSQVTKYYFAGTSRIAMRKYTIPQNMTVEYFLTDHLGSTSLTTDSNGAKVSEMRYKPWGEVRYAWTASLTTTPAYRLADYTFTGQYSDSYINLLWYGSRHYDPALGRFIQPDTIVPTAVQGVQAYDRFAYVSNNPVRYNDPTGHCPMCISALAGAGIGFLVSYGSQAIKNYNSGMELSEALNINNMDKGEILVATVGGAVAGATMGLAAPALAGAMTSELGAYMIAGALSNAAAGIAESTTEAYIEQSLDGSPSWGLDNEGFNEFTTDVYNAGLTPGNVAYDLASGAVLSAGSYAIVRPLTGPIARIPNAMFFDDIYYASKGYYVGASAEFVKATTDTIQQAIQNTIDRRIERKLEMLAQ